MYVTIIYPHVLLLDQRVNTAYSEDLKATNTVAFYVCTSRRQTECIFEDVLYVLNVPGRSTAHLYQIHLYCVLMTLATLLITTK